MHHTLPSKPNRWLGLSRNKRKFSIAVGVLGALTAFFVVPASPGVMLRGNFMHGIGCMDGAVTAYDVVAEHSVFQSQRLRALRRSAVLHDVALGDDKAALVRWSRLARQLSDSDDALAGVWSQIGVLHSRSGESPAHAAVAFEKAAKFSTQDEDSAKYWMAASDQWLLASNSRKASSIWMNLAETDSTHRSEAYVALGQWHLSQGRSEQALTWFERSVETASTDDQRGLAKIGVAICLERLGNLDEAIAELDAADFPEDVRHVRRRKMLERSDQLQFD